MSRFTRILALCVALVLALTSAACGRKPAETDNSRTENPSETKTETPSQSGTKATTDDSTESATPEATEPSSSEAPSSSETEPSSEPEPSSQSSAVKPTEPEGSKLHRAYDLFYSLPDWMLAMKYNGMLGVYEFYTGDFNGSPTGLDFATEVYDEDELKGETLETYILTRSRAVKAGLTNIERVTYNGFEWLRLTNGTNATYYYAVFNEGLYCLLALQNADSIENYLTARDMLEQTLFFEIVE